MNGDFEVRPRGPVLGVRNQKSDMPDPISDMQLRIERIQVIRERVGKTAETLCISADKMFGSVPETLGESTNDCQEGYLGILDMNLDGLERQVSMLANQVSRFNGL